MLSDLRWPAEEPATSPVQLLSPWAVAGVTEDLNIEVPLAQVEIAVRGEWVHPGQRSSGGF